METLARRFGKLLAAHRKRRGLTQAQLADLSRVSLDMIAKLETGASAPRFRTITLVSNALEIDPAELFTSQMEETMMKRPILRDLCDRLSMLPDDDLLFVRGVLDAALKKRS